MFSVLVDARWPLSLDCPQGSESSRGPEMDLTQNWLEFLQRSKPVADWLGGPFWSLLNTPFMASLVPSIVGLLLTRRVAELSEANQDSNAIRSAEIQIAERDKEEPIAPVPANADPIDSFIAASLSEVVERRSAPDAEELLRSRLRLTPEYVQELEAKMNLLKGQLSQRIDALDGRRIRKYANVARYDYRPIILMLARDGAITDDEAYRLVEIFTVWMRYKRRKNEIPQDKAEMIRDFRFAKRRRSNGERRAPENEVAADDAEPATM